MKPNNFKTVLWISISLASILFAFQNCSVGRTPSRDSSSTQISSPRNTGGTTVGNPLVPMSVTFIATHSNVALDVCVKGVTFFDEAAGNSESATFASSVNIQGLSQGSTPLAQVEIKQGKYQRTVVHLSANCASANAMEVTNGNGSYTTNQDVELTFNGEFDAGGILNLNIDEYLLNLGTVRSSPEMQNVVENTAGGIGYAEADLGYSGLNCGGVLVGALYQNGNPDMSIVQAGAECYSILALGNQNGPLPLDANYSLAYGGGAPVPLGVDPISQNFVTGRYPALVRSSRAPNGVCSNFAQTTQLEYVAVAPRTCPWQ